VFISAADFKTNTVKNLLAGGVSRTKYYLAKLILTAGMCVFMMLFFLIMSIIIATILNGFGGDFNMAFIKQIAKIYLPQLYLLFTFGSIGTFLIFTIKNTASLNTIYIALTIAPMIILSIAGRDLIRYDLILAMQYFAIDEIYTTVFGIEITGTRDFSNLNIILMLAGVYILVTTIGGIMLFRKAEIK
jgi:hypothetical protein